MAFIGGAFALVNPSLILPEVVTMYSQSSGAFELLAAGDPLVRLGEGDLFVYLKTMDVRTRVASGQTAYNSLPSCTITMQYISTPTYLVRVRAEYDHHDTAAAGNWGVALPEAQRRAMHQGIFQQIRNALLYGFNPSLGEGIVNTQGAIATTLPADSNGNTTVVTYDNGQMALFLLQQIVAVKTRTYQMGQPVRITMCGPQRVLGTFEYANVVSLTQYQRPGAGTATTGTMVEQIVEDNGDSIEWVYDDTLIGKGAGGTDLIVLVVPEVKRQSRAKFDTNTFAGYKPGLEACIMQLCDMAAPREIPTPLAGGAIDVLQELRITPGWAIRPECVTLISMQYQ
jgi:hypothetical protein